MGALIGRSLPEAVSGIYYQLDELRQLYGVQSVEQILAGVIDRKKRLNRLVELQSKDAVPVEERHEIEYWSGCTDDTSVIW